jgi:hypothetical protein
MTHRRTRRAVPADLAPLTILGAILAIAPGCGEPAPSPSPEPPSAAPAPPSSAAEEPPAAPAAPRPAAPPTTAPASTLEEPADPAKAEFLGFVAPKPATWSWFPPENRMRAANWVVPGASGADQAHVIVFQGIGGGRDANIQRWLGQFRTPEQRPVEPEIETMELDGMPVTFVLLVGERMNMGQRFFTPSQALLAAIIEAPEGELFVTLAGEEVTVRANREDFEAMVRGMRRAE